KIKYGRTRIENLTADWEILLEQGVAGRLAAAREKLEATPPESESAEFLRASIAMLTAVLELADRYADAARDAGETAMADLLRRVPRHPARTLHEALQSMFFLFSMFHLSGVTLQGWGRMDQYLAPYYTRDLAQHRLTREEAGELLSEFFIMLNRENDIYGMVQQGDDGESLMLGGCKRDGSSAINDLTLLILETSYDVSMINPKINLRIDSHTPERILEAGIRLTGRGLGFPQYCNDEVVIPALVNFGYPLEDARDYTVAACWEFVVKNGRDIPNNMAVNLALAADRAIRRALREHADFDTLLTYIAPAIREQLQMPEPPLKPNPLFSAFSGRCIERGHDLHFGGGEHYHFGCHGCGSSTAADSLAAVKKWVYDRREVTPEELLHALETNYRDADALRRKMQDAPKTGNGDDETDGYLKFIFDTFADELAELGNNPLGGRIRPGTGSAQFYVRLTQGEHRLHLGATADGRREGEFISSSLAPAPGVRANGIFSILKTYGTLDYNKLCNGGPITLEFSPAYFRTGDARRKTVEFLRAFVNARCQQMQMNVLDRETLLDAQAHPERHRDLIVRVWGWSGYFVELDKPYQDQIIGRTAYGA
ncbi:MAG: pyruvate formate-lyase, partial [Lentisphaeria bacterium]|nr:pyruvate formate-lyase [Lentisphaeria bacterium]